MVEIDAVNQGKVKAIFFFYKTKAILTENYADIFIALQWLQLQREAPFARRPERNFGQNKNLYFPSLNTKLAITGKWSDKGSMRRP